jgi:UDP-N-acetylmuramate--alanine ligase
LLPHVSQCLIEEDVAVEGERESEGHEPDDREADHDGELPADGLVGVEGHRGRAGVGDLHRAVLCTSTLFLPYHCTVKIYCSGIGGIGLSAYAALQRANGHTVFGSDRAESAVTEDLRSQGIVIATVQDGSAIPSGCDLFVYSEAVPEGSPERRRAQAQSIRSLSYFAALGELSRSYRVIAVSGTHGKSSTTGMLAKVLVDGGRDPTVVVGTKLPDLGGKNWRRGASDLFLLEACEYRRSFLSLHPELIVITTVDGDHFDYYSSEEDYRRAFVEFLGRLPSNGATVVHGGDADVLRIAEESGVQVLDADRMALPELTVPGLHMRQNAQLALAAAEQLGIAREDALRSLRAYRGAWRRMEHLGVTVHGVPVIDDYAHHPREITATLQATRERHPQGRIICVFQPHTHDRTLKLYDAFTRCFGVADTVVIPNVYEARRDRDSATADVGRLAADIARVSGVECMNGRSLEETEQWLRQTLQSGDILLCMGAGDVTQLAHRMLMHPS